MIKKDAPALLPQIAVRFRSSESGAVLVELALLLPWLFLFVVYATDYTMERLAEAQVQAATIAAAEYAQVRGCSYSGIRDAALSAILPNYPRLAEIKDVSTNPTCQCLFSGSTETPGDYQDGMGCTTLCGGSDNVMSEPFVDIGVEATYTPLFPTRWINPGPQSIAEGAKVRTRALANVPCSKGN